VEACHAGRGSRTDRKKSLLRGVQNETLRMQDGPERASATAQAIELCPRTARCRDVMLQWVRGPITAVM